jgi:hypothetical protein
MGFSVTTGKFAVALLTLGLISASPGLAQDSADTSQPNSHHWQMPNKQDMAAWHKRMCVDRYAHVAGRLAFAEEKLDISAAQHPMFDRWRDAVLHDAQTRKDSCLAEQHAPGENVSIVERFARMQMMLEERLAALRSEQPALVALYQSLMPEQKAEFDQHGHRFGEHRGGPMPHRDESHG